MTNDDSRYSTLLAAGKSQLHSIYFEPTVLDKYLRDPRYFTRLGQFDGMICVADAFYRDPDFPEHDKIMIQTFGLAVRPNGQKAVGVMLCYLADLTPEHQRYWALSEIAETEECKLSEPYIRASVFGDFPNQVSPYRAITALIEFINEQAVAMGRPPLFRGAFREHPGEYHPLLAPTRKAYLEFISVLDKMLSENLNQAFFGDDVSLTDAEGNRKGSIQLLGDWLAIQPNPRPVDQIKSLLGPLREVRQLRQEPAHTVVRDSYDLALFDQQKKLMVEICDSLVELAGIFSRLPGAEDLPIPRILKMELLP
jgi:hypothetical protein